LPAAALRRLALVAHYLYRATPARAVAPPAWNADARPGYSEPDYPEAEI